MDDVCRGLDTGITCTNSPGCDVYGSCQPLLSELDPVFCAQYSTQVCVGPGQSITKFLSSQQPP